jgi:YNFM family putative membrane transporter
MLSRALLLLSFIVFASSANMRATDPLLDLISRHFGVTPGSAALVLTAYSLGYGLFQLAHGPLGDRFGKVRMIALMSALSAVGSFASAFAPTLELLAAGRFLTGVTSGAMVPLTMAWIGDTLPYEGRQAALARVLLGGWFGTAAGATASGFLAQYFGWQLIYAVFALMFLVASAILAYSMRSNERLAASAGSASTLGEAFSRLGPVMRLPMTRFVLVIVFLEGIFLMSPTFFAPLHLQTGFGVSAGVGGVLLFASTAGALSFAAMAPRLVPRLGEARLLVTGGLIACVAYGVAAFAPAAAVVFVCLYFAGIGSFMMHNTMQVLATQMAPQARGAAVGLFAGFTFLGQGIGAWIWGRVVDHASTVEVLLAGSVGMLLLATGSRWGYLRLAAKR